MEGAGIFGKDYFYPGIQELDYWKAKGLTLIRLPFKWERIQHQLNGELSRKDMAYIKYLLTEAHKRGMQILLDMHNYGRRKDNGKGRIIGDSVTIDHFAYAWKLIAKELKNNKGLYGYGLMNEPHDMLDSVPWFTIAQKTITEIRKVDSKTPVIIGGNNWSSAMQWREVSDKLKQLSDPAQNLIFEAHCYFDNDGSGIYRYSYDKEKAYPNVGVDRVRPFVEWLKENKLQGFIGEYGIPENDERWLKCLENFLSYISRENINGTYWAAGSQWNNYILSIHPNDNYKRDRTQLRVVTKFPYTLFSKQ
jgi:endoglucanase